MSTIAENIDGLVSCRTIMRLMVTQQARVATNEYCKLTRVSSVMVGACIRHPQALVGGGEEWPRVLLRRLSAHSERG